MLGIPNPGYIQPLVVYKKGNWGELRCVPLARLLSLGSVIQAMNGLIILDSLVILANAGIHFARKPLGVMDACFHRHDNLRQLSHHLLVR